MVVGHPDTAVSGPEMAKERRDSTRRLAEYLGWDALFIGTQTERSELLQPDPNWIPNTVRKMLRRRQVDLNPNTLRIYSGSNSVHARLLRQIHDDVCQCRVVGRVLNSVCWQCAAVADEMSEQSELSVAHGVV